MSTAPFAQRSGMAVRSGSARYFSAGNPLPSEQSIGGPMSKRGRKKKSRKKSSANHGNRPNS
ncbi:MAG: hypothetical protein ABJD68_03015 [Nakamurella sp.]